MIRRKLEWNEPLAAEERMTLLRHPQIRMGITPTYERLLHEGRALSEETRMTLISLIVMTVPEARRRLQDDLPPAVAAARAKQELGEALDAREHLLLRREQVFVLPKEIFPPLG